MSQLLFWTIAFSCGFVWGSLVMWWLKRRDYPRGLWHGEQGVLEMLSEEEQARRP